MLYCSLLVRTKVTLKGSHYSGPLVVWPKDFSLSIDCFIWTDFEISPIVVVENIGSQAQRDSESFECNSLSLMSCIYYFNALQIRFVKTYMFLKKSTGRITSHWSSVMLLKTPTLLIKQKYTMFSEQKYMSLANDVTPLMLSSVNNEQYLRLFSPYLFHIPDIWIPLLTFTLKNR